MGNAIEVNGVWKKFKKGEQFDSLRDLIPNMVKGLMPWNGKKKDELQKQEFWALQDVSFKLKKGEALGIIGPNGSGKSTMLKLLSGILKPNKGEIKINGRLSALIEVGAGFHPDLTGRENVYLNGTIMGMKKKEIDAKFDSIVEFSELEEFIDTPVKRYSSGMYVRLGFSVAVHMEPEILLIDEVLAVGDFSFQRKCMKKIIEMCNKDASIIFISHNLEAIRRLCPTVIYIKKGELNFIGEPKFAIELYMQSINDKFSINNTIAGDGELVISENPLVRIETIGLLDKDKKEKKEFRTGEFMSVEIYYTANKTINNPTFSVGLLSGDMLFADHNSRFEGCKLEFIEGKGKIRLIIDNLMLLPGYYELRAHISDKNALSHYDIKSIPFIVKESKRGKGTYYQPHRWEIMK